MKYDQLAGIEARFKVDNASLLSPFSLPVPGENLQLQGVVYNPPRSGYYYPTAHTKNKICLHFTAGNLRSDMLSLSRNNYHVSVAFVVARDGTIYQLHPSKYWSGHLGAGIGNQGTGNAQDKMTIGIEISNYGLLSARDGNLETIYSRLKDPKTGKIGAADLYCTAQQTEAFTKLNTPFRDQNYYPTYTKEQVESTIILLRFLTAKYQIPRQFLPKEKRFVATNDVVKFKGIVTHVNFRPSGKWDIGPAFDWDGLMSGVTAPSFAPKFVKSQKGLAKVLRAETEIDQLFEKKNESTLTRGLEMESAEATDNENYNPNDYDDLSVKEKSLKAPSGQLFGLLIGINNYESVNKLNGCVGDAEKISTYLKSLPDLKCILKLLTDEAASKKNIVAAFQNHLAKANAQDTVFIFYSGHGTQEESAPYWDETDAALECLVCHDKGAKRTAQFLLTDKEIRYLVYQLYKKTKAHIVLCFDCCHSGDNTRGALQLASADKKAKKKFIVTSRPTGQFEKREWGDFIFSKEIKEPKTGVNIHKLIPEAPHIAFSACESNQSAIEYAGEGVFTKHLLQILKNANGEISYRTLGSRLAQIMRFTEEQTPKLYAPLLYANQLDKGFLNTTVSAEHTVAEVTYNKAQGWQINKGALHNVQSGATIKIYESGSKSKTISAKITNVHIDYATVAPGKTLDKKQAYTAKVEGLLNRKIYLQLDNWHGHPKDTKALVEAIIKRAGGYYAFEGKTKNSQREADYLLSIKNGDLIISKPGDPYRPLVRPMPLVNENDVQPIVNALIHLARWQFIKEVYNKNDQSSFTQFPIEATVRLRKGKKWVVQPVINDVAQLQLSKEELKWGGAFQFQLKNNSKNPLYVAALYLDKNFMSYPNLLPGTVHFLEAGAEVYLENNKSNELQLALGEQEIQYNWPMMAEFIKIFASEEAFDIHALQLENLPAPYVLSDEGKGANKGFINVGEPADKSIQLKKWQSQCIQLQLPNPVYNIASKSTLEALLNYEETAYFAAGIWYTLALDEFGQPTQLVLKKGIKVPEEEKGLIDDFKIWAGNKIETMQRKKMYRRLKDTGRIRIVAEGDSWFQYPILLKDTLDQLYKLYAIRSFAEAGDTLENYMKKKEYLKAVDEENPLVFLISGGGNDILGEEFRGFLHTKPTAGDNTPARYLNTHFNEKLLQLRQWYDEMLKELLDKHPNLYIITQSYDYAIPVDTDKEPNKTSWLGKYMIEKGMKNQNDREELLRYMVDQFNDQLEAAITPYKGRVFYINVRGLTQRTQWFDEIHPTNEGFEAIADRYITIIESLKKK